MQVRKVKPAVTIVATKDLHALGQTTIRGRLLLSIMLYFGEATIRWGIYSRKYGIYCKGDERKKNGYGYLVVRLQITVVAYNHFQQMSTIESNQSDPRARISLYITTALDVIHCHIADGGN